jgi:preprotein translocase subunit Sec61beta
MKRETFNCEFDRAGLVDFFRDVEKIQTQIDALM